MSPTERKKAIRKITRWMKKNKAPGAASTFTREELHERNAVHLRHER